MSDIWVGVALKPEQKGTICLKETGLHFLKTTTIVSSIINISENNYTTI